MLLVQTLHTVYIMLHFFILLIYFLNFCFTSYTLCFEHICYICLPLILYCLYIATIVSFPALIYFRRLTCTVKVSTTKDSNLSRMSSLFIHRCHVTSTCVFTKFLFIVLITHLSYISTTNNII